MFERSIKRRNDNIKVDIRETGLGMLDFLNDSCHVCTRCLNLLTVCSTSELLILITIYNLVLSLISGLTVKQVFCL